MRKLILSAVSLLLCLSFIAGCSSDNTGSGESVSGSSKEETYSAQSQVSSEHTFQSNTSSLVSNIYSNDQYENISKLDNEIVPMGNTSILIENVKGYSDTEAETKRKQILNTTDNLKITGTKYYVSSKNGNDENDGLTPETAWQTTDAIVLNSFVMKEGDGVLFERGCVFRTTSQIFAKSGVTYGAYGKGEKPILYGSVKNYSAPELWTPSNKKYIWKMTLPLQDAGIVVFNHGEAVGCKKNGLLSLEKNFDFYHNTTENTLYVYLDKGRPNKVYKDIEIGTRRAIFTLSSNISNVRIDNLCMKYVGNFAVQCIADQKGVHITNCEIGWIGGSYMNDGYTSRYGNGIQFWDDASDSSVDNCWIYQVYDAGVTFQGPQDAIYDNVDFTNNLIEYVDMAIEFWITKTEGRKDGYIANCDFTGNILRFSGYGFGSYQRPNPIQISFIAGGTENAYIINSLNITDNIFDRSTYSIFRWEKTDISKVNISGNTFYGQKNLGFNVGKSIVCNNYDEAPVDVDLDSFIKAVNLVDKNPKKIGWYE